MKIKPTQFLIIGVSGHGKVGADIALHCGYKDITFLDDNASVKVCIGFQSSESYLRQGNTVKMIFGGNR